MPRWFAEWPSFTSAFALSNEPLPPTYMSSRQRKWTAPQIGVDKAENEPSKVSRTCAGRGPNGSVKGHEVATLLDILVFFGALRTQVFEGKTAYFMRPLTQACEPLAEHL